MAGLLESFGQGLQGAGAILSDMVYDAQQQERLAAPGNLLRSIEIQKAQQALQADTEYQAALRKATEGLQPSALNSASQMLDLHGQIDPAVIARSPVAQANLKRIEMMSARDAAIADRKAQMEQRAYEHLDKMEQRRHEFEVRSMDAAASAADRAEARAAALRLQETIARANLDLKRQGLDIARFNAETRRDSADASRAAKVEKANGPVEDLISNIDQAIKMIQDNPGSTGARGMFSRAGEFVSSTFSGDPNTPANDLQSQIIQIQDRYKKLPTSASNRFKADAGKIDSIIKGLGAMSNDTIAINSLTQLRENLARGLEAKGGTAPAAGGGAPAAPALTGIIAVNPKTKERVISTDGGKTWEPLLDK